MASTEWRATQGAPRALRAFSLEPDRAGGSSLVGQHIVVGLQPGVAQVHVTFWAAL